MKTASYEQHFMEPGVAESSDITYRASIIIISLAYGITLASLPLHDFSDRENYIAYAEFSLITLSQNIGTDWLTFFSNEPVWLALNILLSSFLTPDNVVRTIIGIPASIAAYLILRADPRNLLFLLIILFFPSVIKNYIIHLRQGVAIAIFLTAIYTSNRSIKYILLVLTPFIHSSFFFILFFIALEKILSRLRLSKHAYILLVVIIDLFVVMSVHHVAQFFGVRQFDQYDFTMTTVSGLGFVFWAAVFMLYILERDSFFAKNRLSVIIILFYLISYFKIEVAARIFESGMILVLLAGLRLSGLYNQAFKSLLVCHLSISYLLALDKPMLGFGFE